MNRLVLAVVALVATVALSACFPWTPPPELLQPNRHPSCGSFVVCCPRHTHREWNGLRYVCLSDGPG